MNAAKLSPLLCILPSSALGSVPCCLGTALPCIRCWTQWCCRAWCSLGCLLHIQWYTVTCSEASEKGKRIACYTTYGHRLLQVRTGCIRRTLKEALGMPMALCTTQHLLYTCSRAAALLYKQASMAPQASSASMHSKCQQVSLIRLVHDRLVCLGSVCLGLYKAGRSVRHV